MMEKKDNIEKDNGIQISDDVIATIAGKSVLEIDGVAEMAGGFAGGISEVLSGRKNLAKGIKVDVNGNEVVIDINIIVIYGAKIPDVAFEIQKRVKKAIEDMTGLKVLEVNVHIQGVDIPTKKVEKKEKVVEVKETKKDVKKEEKKAQTKVKKD